MGDEIVEILQTKIDRVSKVFTDNGELGLNKMSQIQQSIKDNLKTQTRENNALKKRLQD